ncbi:MAG: hypothetical protein L0Y64_06910 [Myxococcaceae bacterium]|nr:hypothetical protein [Myxococcaceae bacterium]
MRAWMGAVAFLWLGCTVQTVGAPCEDDLQCPTGQHCSILATCKEGARSVEQLGESCTQLMEELVARAGVCHGSPRDASLRAVDAKGMCASLQRSVAEGRLDFVPEQFGACARAARAADCAIVTHVAWAREGLLAVCPAFVPKVAGGAACSSSAECVDGWCDTKSACPGVCKRYVPAGSPCTAQDLCAPGSTCVSDECRTDAKLAEACPLFGVQCAADAFCGDGSTCEARKTSGACTARGWDGHAECALGHHCVPVDPQAGADSPRECRPVKELGETCTPGAHECGALLYCDDASRTCQSYPGAGAACGNPQRTGETVGCLGTQCSAAGWFENACQPYQPSGVGCLTDDACGPGGTCHDWKCTPFWCTP